jgi:Flp pilus assembly pilin Flp
MIVASERNWRRGHAGTLEEFLRVPVVRRQLHRHKFSLTGLPFGASPPGVPRRHRREVNRMMKLYSWIATSSRREEGQTMAEYGVILAVITSLIIGALLLLSTNIFNVLTRVASAIV